MQHTHTDPALYTAALTREEQETGGAPVVSGALAVVLFLLALLVALAPRSPRWG